MHCDTYYDSRQSRHVEIPDAVKRLYTVAENQESGTHYPSCEA